MVLSPGRTIFPTSYADLARRPCTPTLGANWGGWHFEKQSGHGEEMGHLSEDDSGPLYARTHARGNRC